MVEIRTFEGDAAEMASFTTAMWRKSYSGKMPMPLWTPEFLEWELMAGGNSARDYLVAAYDGVQLIGFLPAKPQPYRVVGRDVPGTMGSYLSVDPDYRRQGIALKMHQEQQRRHRERGAAINMGFVYLGAAVAQGKKFWLKQPEGATIVAKVGLWSRLLDHKAVARFEMSRAADVGSRVLGQMKDEGLHAAVMLRIASSPPALLICSGFVPLPADYYYIGLVMEPGFRLGRAKRLHVHWR